jgi:Secretion system C-terminal sorting domain
MKKLTLIFSAFVFCISAIAQIPNGDFETWTNTTSPSTWQTSNGSGAPTAQITQYSPGHNSAHAVQLVPYFDGNMYPAVIMNNFGITGTPTSGEYFVKGNIAFGDTLACLATFMTSTGDVVGIGMSLLTDYSFSSFESQTFDISYFGAGTPTAVSLYFMLVTHDQNSTSTIQIDDLSIEGAFETSISETHTTWASFKNNENTVEFTLNQALDEASTVRIFDLYGNLVISELLAKGCTNGQLNIATLSSGAYIVTIVCSGKSLTRKIVK